MRYLDPVITQRVRLFDFAVTPMSSQDVVTFIRDAAPVAAPIMIANQNLHSAYLYHSIDWYREFYQAADVTLVDGWPVLKLLSRPLNHEYRVGSTDWLEALLTTPPEPGRRLKVYVFGSDEVANARCVERLRSSDAIQEVAGESGYLAEADWEVTVRRIKQFAPDLVLVGMGMPTQELFLHRHRDDLYPAVYATVGGAIDYLAGTRVLAPRWLGRFGLEWMWRLALEPRRLSRRYLVEPVKFAHLLHRSRHARKARHQCAPPLPH